MSADAIVTGGEDAIRALQQATKTIPIVGMSADMVEYGYVNSLARPDGNMTGVSILATDLDGKRQDILIEAVPGLRRMAALSADDVNRRSLMHCSRRRAPRVSSFQSIVLPEVRRSQ